MIFILRSQIHLLRVFSVIGAHFGPPSWIFQTSVSSPLFIVIQLRMSPNKYFDRWSGVWATCRCNPSNLFSCLAKWHNIINRRNSCKILDIARVKAVIWPFLTNYCGNKWHVHEENNSLRFKTCIQIAHCITRKCIICFVYTWESLFMLCVCVYMCVDMTSFLRVSWRHRTVNNVAGVMLLLFSSQNQNKNNAAELH